MRITNNIMVSNMMRHLQDNMSKLDRLNQQLDSEKQFQVPSDSPIKVASSMQLHSLINHNEQYERNIDEAKTWLENSESSLDAAGTVLLRIKELAVKGATSLAQGDRDDIAKEVKQLRKELVGIVNSKLGDRYLFSGQATGTEPFDKSGEYQGDYNSLQREINPGIKMAININGEKAFKGAIDVLDSLHKNLLEGKSADISKFDLVKIDQEITANTTIRAEIGAKTNRLDLTEKRLGDEKLNLTKLLSENEDVDIEETVMNLKMQEAVYRASLASGARIIQPTLVDFLR